MNPKYQLVDANMKKALDELDQVIANLTDKEKEQVKEST